MATKIEKDVMLGKIAGTIRNVNFIKLIEDQDKLITQLKRMSGSKPDKIEQAYLDKQELKLKELQDIVKRWIWEAFDNDEEVVEKTFYWNDIVKNFDIEVIVKKK